MKNETRMEIYQFLTAPFYGAIHMIGNIVGVRLTTAAVMNEPDASGRSIATLTMNALTERAGGELSFDMQEVNKPRGHLKVTIEDKKVVFRNEVHG